MLFALVWTGEQQVFFLLIVLVGRWYPRKGAILWILPTSDVVNELYVIFLSMVSHSFSSVSYFILSNTLSSHTKRIDNEYESNSSWR